MKQETMMFAAALIQAGGAILFAGTVIYEAIRRHLERKAQIIQGLHYVWNQSTDPPKTLEEQVGPPFASPRQIRFYGSTTGANTISDLDRPITAEKSRWVPGGVPLDFTPRMAPSTLARNSHDGDAA